MSVKDGEKHGSWHYENDAADDKDWWTIAWPYNYKGEATKVKTQTFNRVPDTSFWFHKANDPTYSSILTIPPSPAADDAGSMRTASCGRVLFFTHCWLDRKLVRHCLLAVVRDRMRIRLLHVSGAR